MRGNNVPNFLPREAPASVHLKVGHFHKLLEREDDRLVVAANANNAASDESPPVADMAAGAGVVGAIGSQW